MIDNYVVTTGGFLKRLYELKIGDIIWTQKGYCVITHYQFVSKNLSVYHTNGGLIFAPDDLVVVNSGKKVLIKNSKLIDILRGPLVKKLKRDVKLVMDGLVIGDGSVHNSKFKYLNVGKKDGDYFESEIKKLILGRQPSTHNLGWKIDTNVAIEELPYLPQRSIPERYLINGPEVICSFLRGLFSANGTASGARIGLRSTNYKLIRQSQTMLSSVGIRSYTSYNAPREIKWKNGVYTSKEAWDLNINVDRATYYANIGFLQKYKCNLISDKLRYGDSYGEKNTFEITNVESLPVSDGWPQIKVDNKYNTFWLNGLNVCGD